MTCEKEQRIKAYPYFIDVSEENIRLETYNKRHATIGPSKKDRFIERDIEVAREETYTKCMADFEAKLAVVENKHDADLVANAAKYDEKCKDLHIS